MDTSPQSTKKISHDIFVTSSEIPNSEQATHILRAQKLILEKIVQNHDLPSTLETLCLQFENTLSPAICIIRLFDSQTGLMQIKVSPNMPESLRADLEKFFPEDCRDSGNSGVLPQKVVILPVREEDPIREKTKKYGIQSYWSISFATTLSTPIGAFTVLHQKLRHPSTFDLYAIETAAHLAGLALQRHEEERELHANKERLQDLFDSAPVAYFTSSMDGKIIRANTCAAELTGISKEALTGRSVIDLYSPTLRGRKKAERIHTWIKHGLEVEGEELELERPDGSRRWVSLTVRLIRDSMGTPIERRGILEDISHRKQAEHLLAEQKTILEMIAKGQPLNHTLSRLCQGIEIASPEIQCSIHQLKGAKLQFLAAPSLPKAYTTKINSFEIGPAAGSCGTAAYRHEPVIVSDIATDPLWNKGRTLALQHGLQACWSIPISSSTNEVLGTIAMYYPTPRTPSREDWELIESSTKLAGIALEQDRDRAALKQSEARYRTLYDDNPSMYFTIALDGTVRSVNHFGASQLGFTTGELLGTSVFALCHPDDRSDLRCRVQSYLQAPTDLENLEFRQIRKDGSIISVQVSMRLVKSSEQESVLLLVSENVTTQKHIKETLVASEHAIRKLYDITSSPNLAFHERIRALLKLGCERFNLPIGMVTHCSDGNIIFQFVHAPIEMVSEGTKAPTHETFCGSTMEAGTPIEVERVSETEWRHHPGYSALGLECYLGTKIMVGPGTYGTLCFASKAPYAGIFSEADKDFLQLMSRWIGTELERIQASEDLEKHHAFLQAVLEGTNDAFSVKNLEGRYLMINSAGARLLGKTPSEVIGRNDLEVLSPEEAKAQHLKDLEILATKRNETFEVLNTQLNMPRTYLTTKSPFYDSTGKVIGIFGNARDITDRKKAEQALQSIVEGTGSVSTEDFFHTLTRALAQCLNVKYAFVTEWTDSKQERVKTLSFWNEDRIAENFVYELGETPCQRVMEGQVCFYSQGVQGHFPKDPDLRQLGVESYLGIPLYNTAGKTIGHLVAMDCQPLPTDADSVPALKIFAARAAAELERKRAEDALRRSENRLRQVIDLVPHFIFAKDATGRFILANKAVAEVYGTTAQNLIGKTDKDFSHSSQETDHFRKHDLEVLETGKAKSIEECITDAQGHIRYLYTIKIPFVFANSALPAILGVAIDITDRKQGEDALRLTQHVFDILPDHVAVVGPDYRYRRVNKVYEQVHGMPATEILGKHISDLLGKQTFLRDIKPNFDRCLAGDSVSFERWFHFHNGQDRFMAVTYSPLRAKEKPHGIEAVVVNSRDLTPRKHMEETLKENEEHLRILLDERIRISQDLHDHVLQSIYAVGLIIAAIRKPLETKNFSEVHEFLEQAVRQVNHSIVDIRGFIEGLPQADLDSGDFKTELTHLVQSMTIPDGPTFTIRVGQKAIDLLSNRDTVHLINIARESMSNCLRHAKATKGSITFTHKKGSLQFEIRDNGVGFHQEGCSHSGHGLVNMDARAKQLHGTLTIRSAPNKGTRVIIHIPINTSTQGK